MKKSFAIIVFLSLGVVQFIHAQKIETEKVFGGYKYTQDGKVLNMKQLVNAMEPNTESFELMKKAQANTSLASVTGFVGGALIGWPLGAALADGDPNWALAGIGAAVIVATIPIASKANKQAKQAVELHNTGVDVGYQRNKPKFELSNSGLGIRLAMNL